MLRSTDVFTVLCPNSECGHKIDRSAWWLLQRESQGLCPACGADLAKAIDNQRLALRKKGYGGRPAPRAAGKKSRRPRPRDNASVVS
ncbi:MAG: hypothetical protein WBL23_05685 [Salinisphaera sp.]|uniref:hypothetical protein n=1 Tax=Salinisphaera sp. TaxID=1914330 RepID=UPI003C7CE43C